MMDGLYGAIFIKRNGGINVDPTKKWVSFNWVTAATMREIINGRSALAWNGI
ncbi:MAG: hypothetical protein Q9184_004089 [Pyrenodesmia sp. 2 TL-2023]